MYFLIFILKFLANFDHILNSVPLYLIFNLSAIDLDETFTFLEDFPSSC